MLLAKVGALEAALSTLEKAEDRTDHRLTALTGAIDNLCVAIETNTEAFERLHEKLTEKPKGGGELQELIASIDTSLKQLVEDGTRTTTAIMRIPNLVATAAHDAVRMGLGDAIDLPPERD